MLIANCMALPANPLPLLGASNLSKQPRQLEWWVLVTIIGNTHDRGCELACGRRFVSCLRGAPLFSGSHDVGEACPIAKKGAPQEIVIRSPGAITELQRPIDSQKWLAPEPMTIREYRIVCANGCNLASNKYQCITSTTYHQQRMLEDTSYRHTWACGASRGTARHTVAKGRKSSPKSMGGIMQQRKC